MRYLIALLALVAPPAVAQGPTHPLEPLSGAEIGLTAKIVRADSRFRSSTQFTLISLKEPPKATVLAWRPGTPVPREGFAILFDRPTNATIEVVVDLVGKRIASWHPVAGAQPWRLEDDDSAAAVIVKADPRWQAALRRRGITDPAKVSVFAAPAEGYLPFERDGSRRVIVLTSVAGQGGSVDGLRVFANLSTGVVTSVEDRGGTEIYGRPSPTADSLRAIKEMGPRVKPLHLLQPEGPSFEVSGHEVRWQNWRFRFGMEPRSGLILYQTTFHDRSVLYRGAVSEMAVPYGDPGWHIWAPLDAGWVGLGNYSKTSFEVGADVPENARFFASAMHDRRGSPITVPRAVALYERDGGVLWRHGAESRRSRELVLAFFATVDNYDYGFSWVFRQDGTLAMEIVLTGQMNAFGVAPEHSSAYGTMVAPGVFAPNHQHFFNFRLDLDVDGVDHNSVEEMDVAGEAAPPNEANGFRSVMTVLETERKAQRLVAPERHRMWRVFNPTRKNRLGQTTAYAVEPEGNTTPMVPEGSFIRDRVGFVNSHLWVTPFQDAEMFAAGDYPYLGNHGDGLPAWTKADRPVVDRDIVVWYTLGVTHVPRPEDWPVMPAVKTGFKLVPMGFFSENPALTEPRTGSGKRR